MSKVFFTSDTHFGHERIIGLARRPYSSVSEMDESLIRAWNDRVGTSDTVYHLGDFAFCDHGSYLSRLQGIKHLIRGNHDHRNRVRSDGGLWQSVSDLAYLSVDGTDLVLCHYAMRVWKGSHKGAVHLYGHSHGSLPGDSQSCDVGVDVWQRPVDLSTIVKHLGGLPIRIEPDHHAFLDV
ncbi:metallophosphoesterase family protein [Tardiphaga sp. 709]|uniref:metallophosphoesterase family protein n=1 Tax=Tardiphaga sp. 709 TaxID=3076039 RepID=UPI0028F08185|nr:metallophosphoesterase family protein [Tardiphaga sp. 709]WNV10127.1 metallophosphoesterase family protein [Tardiphaga sp. 709]